MFKNKELEAKIVELEALNVKLEGDLESQSTEQLEAVNAKLTEASDKLVTAEASIVTLTGEAEVKDTKITDLEASQGEFDKKVDAAVTAEVAKLGEVEPIKGSASTGKDNIELNAEYKQLAPGAERTEFRKKNKDFKLITQ